MTGPATGARPDEQALWRRVLAGERPRDAGRDLGIHPNRTWYLCEKWSRRGFYEYGVSADLGWPLDRRPEIQPLQLAELQGDLDELERTDPAVAAAVRSYDVMVDRLRRDPRWRAW